ncbi:MAG: adenine phosphoribosyltransferase [Candidatus Magnetomorum sp.]|nr:adenine phosphoribosyltransferase [Candidatus Magnetomorum sp.]
MDLKETIRSIPHWPIESVTFRDITTLMQNPEAFMHSCDLLYERYKGKALDKIVAIDARGFVFGAVLAYKLKIGLVPVRKKGKLPSSTIQADYTLEYGVNTVEMHDDSIAKGEKVIIVDDLIATGGTVAAAVQLVEQLGGEIVECAFVIELPDLHGRQKISKYPVFSLVAFEGE